MLDDEPSVLKAVGRLLASEGLSAEKFTDAACFLAFAKSHPVRLAVIDVRMPGRNGFEVMAELRVHSPDGRVILMTGENNPSHRSAAVAAGASAFFLKPFDDDAFMAAVRDALAPSA